LSEKCSFTQVNSAISDFASLELDVFLSNTEFPFRHYLHDAGCPPVPAGPFASF